MSGLRVLLGERQAVIARCLMCSKPVPEKGDTCSLDCYMHFAAYIAAAGPYIPAWMPAPNSMESQLWWDREQERIQAHAEEHDADTSLFEGER